MNYNTNSQSSSDVETRNVSSEATPSGLATREEPEPSIYVACLAAYNSGILHGRWISCNQDAEEIEEEIQAILESSPAPGAEEWAIHDYEGFSGFRLDEHEDIQTLAELAGLISDHGELIAHLVEHCGGLGQLEEACRMMEECYQGAYDNTVEWAEDFLEETGALNRIPEDLRGYFDFDRYAHDAELSGDIITIETGGKTHIFWSR